MIENEEEIWKALPGVPGVEVSTLGRVRALDRVTSSETYTRFTKGRVLKQSNNISGYMYVSIKAYGKYFNKRVHRLVAQTFLPNPNDLPEVNHKDNNPLNNNASNLEWCTHEYNIAYREKYGTPAKESVPKSPLFAINLSTLEVLNFRSQHEASRELGVDNSNINRVIKGGLNQTHGYWFVNDDENSADAIKQKLYEIKHRSALKMC